MDGWREGGKRASYAGGLCLDKVSAEGFWPREAGYGGGLQVPLVDPARAVHPEDGRVRSVDQGLQLPHPPV